MKAIPINTTVELNEFEMELAQKVGLTRNSSNRESNRVDGHLGEGTSEDGDVVGMGGEIAYCKMNNVYPDLKITPKGGEHAKYDAIVTVGGKDVRVDVKATPYKHGSLLLLKKTKLDDADVYCLMIADGNRYTFKGYMRAKTILQSDRLRDFGHGRNYEASQWELIDNIADALRFDTSTDANIHYGVVELA